MFKQKWMIAVIVVACLMIYLVLFNYSRNNKHSWAPTFESNTTSPFGTAYVLKLLPSIFNKSTVEEVDIPIHTFLKLMIHWVK